MLTRAEKDTYRKRLEALRVRLSRAETQLKGEALQATGGEASGGLSDLPIHPADLGSHQYEENLALDLLENEGYLLDEIEAALDRLEDGAFGRCEICKKTLPRQRLQAVPYARHCIECARNLEKKAAP